MATDTNLNFILEAQNRVSGEIAKVNSSLKDMGKAHGEAAASAKKSGSELENFTKAVVFGNTIYSLAADGARALKAQFSSVMKAADDWATAQTQLNAAVTSTHDISGVTAEAATTLAESIQRTTPISRAAALSAEDMLLTFTNIGKNVFPQATTAVADMATRMNNGLTPSAQMLSNTAIQVGKALSDPVKGITALHRVGVMFTEQQKAQIKEMVGVGDTAGAQRLIIAELGKEFGGSAAAGLDTFAGKQEQMKNQMDDAKATIGQAIEGAIKPFTAAIASFVSSEKFKQWIKDIAQYIKDFSKDLQNIGAFYMDHKRLINDLAQVVAALAGAFMLVSGALRLVAIAQAIWNAVADTNPIMIAVVALIAVILLLVTHWKSVTRAAEQVWHDVSGFFSSLANDISGFFDRIWQSISGAFNKVRDFIVGIFRAEWNGLIRIWGGVGGFFSSLWDTIKRDAGRITDFITAPFRAAFNAIARLWNNTVGSLSFKIPSWVPGIGGKGFDMPKLPYLAAGTDNFQGGLAIVGEQGAELVSLPQGAQVTPASQTSQLMKAASGGGNQPNQSLNITVNMGMYAGLPSEKRAIAVDLYKEMTREARSHGVQLPQIGSVSVQ